MKYGDFIYLNVKGSVEHALRVIPPTDKYAKTTLAQLKTEIEFLRSQGLIKSTAAAYKANIENAVIYLSDLTDEGQDFVMSGATRKWLGSCDSKSNRLLSQGASDEQRLAVYQDMSGLMRRLDKFRAERAANSH
jgi:hypothetical protein